MSRKTFTIIIIVGIIVLAVGGLFLSRAGRRVGVTGEKLTFREFLPFGRAPEKEIPEVEEPEITEIPEVAEEPEEIVIPKLRKISEFAVAGAATFQRERVIESEITAEELEAAIDFSEYPTLRLGDSGKEVENLQIVLNRFLEKTGSGLALSEVEGEFDEATKNAVIEFQEENDLVADGIAGKKTFAALNEFQGISEAETETITAVRYIERATGYIYETFLDETEERKISITNIPRSHEVFLGNGGENIIFRYLATDNQTIETFAGVLFGGTLENSVPRELTGTFLTQNITDLSVSPDGGKMFYISEVNDSSVGITVDFDGSNKKQIFDSPFTEWLSQWVSERIITLNTKSSAVAPGFLYKLDTKTKSFDKVLGNIDGLTTLMSPNSKFVLFSKSITDSFETALYNVTERSKSNFGVTTLPEKCVWSGNNENVYCAVPKFIEPDFYPDVWYQGLVSFSDSIWRINTETLVSDLLADPVMEAGEEIDVIKLSLSENEDYLIFINKKDSTLWSLEL